LKRRNIRPCKGLQQLTLNIMNDIDNLIRYKYNEHDKRKGRRKGRNHEGIRILEGIN
jgi:hypothetical protein